LLGNAFKSNIETNIKEQTKVKGKMNKLERRPSFIDENYRQEMSIFMERYKKVPKRLSSHHEEPAVKERKSQQGHQGQLLQGVLEDIEADPLASTSTITSSFVNSITGSEELTYGIEGRNVQSASTNKPSQLFTLQRSKTTMGTTSGVKKLKHAEVDDVESIGSRLFVADVELEKPKLPSALFWTRGDGSFITGREQLYIKQRMAEKHQKLKSHSTYELDCKSYLTLRRPGTSFTAAFRNYK